MESDRPAIFKYITDRFGVGNTARVAAYGTLADKSVIEEIGRALRQTDEKRYSIPMIDGVKKEYGNNPEATKAKYPDIFCYFDGLVGTRVSQSVHPAGMVISPVSLVREYGVFDKDGESCLMLDMDEAHEVGLAKYDFLILKTVQVIRDTCRFLDRPYPKTYEIDWNDQAVWEDMYRNAATVFQFESSFAADSLRKFRARSIFDMSIVTACIRPSGTSYRDALLARKPHTNPSPIIDDLLKDNLGYLIYQEDTIKFLQQICGLSGSAADNVRRAIGRKQKDRLEAALPAILDGYCSKSDQPREIAEEEAKEFLQIIEDSASYQFGYNHSVAYCLLGYLCGYFRYYHPLEYLTAYLNNAANDEDIQVGTAYANRVKIQVTLPKWGISRSTYSFDRERNVIAKGLSSIKYMGVDVAEELYALSQQKHYDSFMDLLWDLSRKTALDSRQLDLLIKIDFFSEFGNQRELLRMVDLYNLFKKGEAKQIRKTQVDGTPLEPIIQKYAVGVTKSGGVAKSYTLLDVKAILLEVEKAVLSAGMSDLSELMKIQNCKEIMGYLGYITGRPQDRRKLFVMEVKPLFRKSDQQQFGYSVYTKSIGSGRESRFTLMSGLYKRDPVRANDIIYCDSYVTDGPYFRLTGYHKITAV